MKLFRNVKRCVVTGQALSVAHLQWVPTKKQYTNPNPNSWFGYELHAAICIIGPPAYLSPQERLLQCIRQKQTTLHTFYHATFINAHSYTYIMVISSGTLNAHRNITHYPLHFKCFSVKQFILRSQIPLFFLCIFVTQTYILSNPPAPILWRCRK